MDIKQITDAINNAILKLQEQEKGLKELAEKRALSETKYRVNLSKELFLLKKHESKLPSSIILDIAKGNNEELLYERELYDSLFTAKKESMKAIQTEISSLQTIARFYDVH